jgi:hypothetical protein
MNYTVLAYNPSYSTRCGDYYHSDFEYETFTDPDKAIAFAARYYLKKMNDSEDYELTFLFNGLHKWHIDDEDEAYANLPDIEDAAFSMASAKNAELKAAKEKEQADALARQQERKRNEDLKLLAQLKQQYGE